VTDAPAPERERPLRALEVVGLSTLLVVLIYTGVAYATLRNLDDEELVPFALAERFTPVYRLIARREILRRVRSNAATGADVLIIVLAVPDASGFNTDAAFEFANDLVASGVDVNAASRSGFPPLYAAISAANYRAVEFLLEACADPALPVQLGRDQTAMRLNALDVAYLLEAEAEDSEYSEIIGLLERSGTGAGCGAG
jgi:hypothetical protein